MFYCEKDNFGGLPLFRDFQNRLIRNNHSAYGKKTRKFFENLIFQKKVCRINWGCVCKPHILLVTRLVLRKTNDFMDLGKL